MVMLDREYATAFAWEAYKSGDLKIRLGSERKIGCLDDAVRELFRPRNAAKRSRAVLQLATIHESVILHSVPAGYHFTLERLVREGVVAGVSAVGAISEDQSWPTGYVAMRFEPLIPRLTQYCRAVLRIYAPEDAARLDARCLRDISGRLFNILDENRVSDGKALIVLYRSFHQKDLAPSVGARDGMERMISAAPTTTGISADSMMRLIIVILSEVMSVLMLDAFSTEEARPYVSDVHGRPDRKVNIPNPSRLGEAYELCCLAMRDIVDYEPVVESIDDMLRLRADPRIGRFRAALARWAEALQKGETDVLMEVKREVTARNRELTRLSAWRRVDQWLYWSALPLAAVPVVSTIHTVVSVGIRWKIERTLNSNWLCLGR